LTTARSSAIASSRRTKPWSRTGIDPSGKTSGITAISTSVTAAYVGTSGFSYPTWRGAFYPRGARPSDFLRHYAGRLPSVELNAPFYGLPSEEQLARWAAQTPAGFRFAVKMNRGVTHLGRPDRIGTFCERVRVLGDRLGPVLLQFPPTRERDDGLLTFLLGSLDPDLEYAWEFRHPSWEGVGGVVRVNDLDAPGPFRYLRLREPPYDENALRAWAGRLRPLLAAGVRVYCYFKHEDEPAAPRYAERLLDLLAAGRGGGIASGTAR
jgi:uncharacterized protein YecE (DUF72 family)